jgi:hypothetical protein
MRDAERKGYMRRGRDKEKGTRTEKDVLVYDCSEELKTWEDLSLWDRGLDDGRYLCDPDILGRYIVRSRYSRNVDICK